MTQKTPITVAYGDGIGPEIMRATLDIITAAGAQLDIEEIETGEKVYLSGNPSGIAPSAAHRGDLPRYSRIPLVRRSMPRACFILAKAEVAAD